MQKLPALLYRKRQLKFLGHVICKELEDLALSCKIPGIHAKVAQHFILINNFEGLRV